MASGIKSYDENLVGRRVKFRWPKDNLFYEGFVSSSHSHSGENLGTQKSYPAHASSRMLLEMGASKGYGEELVGCKLKVCRPKSKTFSEGVVASYDHSNEKHLVVYTNGVGEMLNLRKHIETIEDVSADQAQRAHSPARDLSSRYADDDVDAHLHVGKKHKGQPSGLKTCTESPVLSKDQKIPKLEPDIAPINSKLSSIPGDDSLHDVNGYKVKTTYSPILEAIFSKYGDIAARCMYKSTSVRASLLEVVSNVVQRLQYPDFEAILSNLEIIENEVSDVEASKIDVSSLCKHLAQLRKIVPFREKSIEIRKTKAKSGIITKAAANELKERRSELLLAQERFKEAEKCVNAMRLVSQKIDDDIMESESEEYLGRRRLEDLL